MSVEVQDREMEIDLSKLIDLSMTFKPLQITLQDILKRLAALEHDNTTKAKQINDLNDAMESLKKQQAQTADELEEALKRKSTVEKGRNEKKKDEIEAYESEDNEKNQYAEEGDEQDEEGEAGDAAKKRQDSGMCNYEDEHARIWEEIDALKDLLGTLQGMDEQHRHSIEELYAARKRLEKRNSGVMIPSAHDPERSVSAVEEGGGAATAGDKILILAQEDLGLGVGGTGGMSCTSSQGYREPQQQQHPSSNFEDDAGEKMEPTREQPSPTPSGASRHQHSPTPTGTSHREPSRTASTASGKRPSPGTSVKPGTPGDSVSPTSPGRQPSSGHKLPPATPSTPGKRSSRDASAISGTLRWQPDATVEASGAPGPNTSSGNMPRPHPSRPVASASSRQNMSTASQSDIFPAKSLDGYATEDHRNSRHPRQSISTTIADKMRRDNDDIAHLNRIVAEILGEMKGLHEDVDLLRTYNCDPEVARKREEDRNDEDGSGGHKGTARVSDDDLANLRRRLTAVENRTEEVNDDSKRRDGDLQEEINDLLEVTRACSRLTEEDVDRVKALGALQKKIREMDSRLAALEAANQRLASKLDSVLNVCQDGNADAPTDINAAQFALLKATVDELEKQLADLQNRTEADWSSDIARLAAAIDRLREDIDDANVKLREAEQECQRLEEAKANKSHLAELSAVAQGGNSNLNNNDSSMSNKDGHGAETNAMLEELLRRLNGLTSRLDEADGRIAYLDEEKADRSALQRLRDDLNNLKRLMELNVQRDSARDANAAGGGSSDGHGGTSALTEQLIREMQQQLLSQSENSHNDRETAKEDLGDLRELLEQLDHRKADATLVANKAERDYVENALERLMREVEQVLNATNAGLIDTLDKSLNILRDMIDGKATKQDITRLQQIMAEDGAASAVGDGLTGFKGYRCLGCNRPMESLRPRTLPSKMQSFLNRNPQNYPQDNVTRSIQQQSQTMALLEQRQQGNPVRSGDMNGSQRSVSSEPLPPIESGK